MGRVFLAVDGRERPVALKTLREELASDEAFRRRFGREVSAVCRVEGRCTAKLIDADLEAPQPWLATEFVDGPTLSEYVRSHGHLLGGNLTALAVGLLEALAAIHAAGVIHRDLTPNNVILAADGPKVVDFGIAHHLDAASAITATGTVLGTPAWMSPEQAEGRPATTATDVFAWGIVVAFAGLGRPPFGEGRPEAVVYRIVHGEPVLAGLPDPPLAQVRAALRKPPEDRPDVLELVQQLGVSGDGDLTEAADRTLQDDWTIESPPLVQTVRRARRTRWVWIAAAAVPVLVGAAVVLVALLARPDPDNSRESANTTGSGVAPTTATTLGTTTTTVPQPPPPSPEELWTQTLQTLPAGTGGSPVVRIGDLPLAASLLDAEAQVWEFRDGTWVPQHAIPLEIAAITDAQIQTADPTGDGVPDFVVSFSGASRPLGMVLSSTSGTWRPIPFEAPDGSSIAENLTVQGDELTSYINSCIPNCAEGSLVPTPWIYEQAGGYFRALSGLPGE